MMRRKLFKFQRIEKCIIHYLNGNEFASPTITNNYLRAGLSLKIFHMALTTLSISQSVTLLPV